MFEYLMLAMMFVFGLGMGGVFALVFVRIFTHNTGFKRLAYMVGWLLSNGVITSGAYFLQDLVIRQTESMETPSEAWATLTQRIIVYLGGFGVPLIVAVWQNWNSIDSRFLKVFEPLRRDMSEREIDVLYFAMCRKMLQPKIATKLGIQESDAAELLSSALIKIRSYLEK